MRERGYPIPKPTAAASSWNSVGLVARCQGHAAAQGRLRRHERSREDDEAREDAAAPDQVPGASGALYDATGNAAEADTTAKSWPPQSGPEGAEEVMGSIMSPAKPQSLRQFYLGHDESGGLHLGDGRANRRFQRGRIPIEMIQARPSQQWACVVAAGGEQSIGLVSVTSEVLSGRHRTHSSHRQGSFSADEHPRDANVASMVLRTRGVP